MDEKEKSLLKNDKTKNTTKSGKKAKSKNIDKKIWNEKLNLIEELKLEIASELGITQQIQEKGWDSLSPSISGKIGGKLSQRLRKMHK